MHLRSLFFLGVHSKSIIPIALILPTARLIVLIQCLPSNTMYNCVQKIFNLKVVHFQLRIDNNHHIFINSGLINVDPTLYLYFLSMFVYFSDDKLGSSVTRWLGHPLLVSALIILMCLSLLSPRYLSVDTVEGRQPPAMPKSMVTTNPIPTKG